MSLVYNMHIYGEHSVFHVHTMCGNFRKWQRGSLLKTTAETIKWVLVLIIYYV